MTASFEEKYRGKRVAVTGHSGFTGGWLVAWLEQLGADVCGLSLRPDTDPNLFSVLQNRHVLGSHFGDIRDQQATSAFFAECQPDIVFHLAAQPLVKRGYDEPHLTFDTNVMGTFNVLQSASNCAATRAVVCITTDKVYRNQEWVWGYRETDELGGKDPYSASKSASEMVIAAFQHDRSRAGEDMLVASARGGNIIGGGDWSADRIVPDHVRAFMDGAPLTLRNPAAVRPWQHVLALVHGYLALGAELIAGESGMARAWNFGPKDDVSRTVGDVVDGLSEHMPLPRLEVGDAAFAETAILQLNSDLARNRLGWKPALDFSQTVEWTARWYRSHIDDPSSARQATLDQIAQYRALIS